MGALAAGEVARKLASAAEGDNRFQLIAVCVDDSHFPQAAKVVHHLGVTHGKQSLVERIDFIFIFKVNILDVERFGFRVSHTSFIVDPLHGKSKGRVAGLKMLLTSMENAL